MVGRIPPTGIGSGSVYARPAALEEWAPTYYQRGELAQRGFPIEEYFDSERPRTPEHVWYEHRDARTGANRVASAVLAAEAGAKEALPYVRYGINEFQSTDESVDWRSAANAVRQLVTDPSVEHMMGVYHETTDKTARRSGRARGRAWRVYRRAPKRARRTILRQTVSDVFSLLTAPSSVFSYAGGFNRGYRG